MKNSSSNRWNPLLQEISIRWKREITDFQVLSQSERSCVLLIKGSENEKSYILKCGPKSGFGEREASCLKRVFHPNIVNLVETLRFDEMMCLVLEEIDGQSLIQYLLSQGKISENDGAYITYQIALALSHLHKKGWIHRDVKPDNIIFNPKTKLVKLIDFEFSCEWSKWKKINSKMGTLKYSSPEVRQGKYVGPEVDVWSLGITLFTLIEGRFPFSDDELSNFHERDITLQFTIASEKCANLIRNMLQTDSRKRITVEKILLDEWILENKKPPARPIRCIPSAPQSLVLSEPLVNEDEILRTSASTHAFDFNFQSSSETLPIEKS